MSESTRLMCVGAYIDDGFADEIQQQLDMQDVQALAPSYGVDPVVLGHHAKQAQAMSRSRDMTIFASWLVALITVPLVALLWLVIMKGRLAATQGIQVPGMHTWRRSRSGALRVQSPLSALVSSLAGWVVLLVLLGGFAVVPLADFSFLPGPLMITAILVCLIAVPWIAAWHHQQQIWEVLKTLRPGRTPVPGPPPGNVVIYSGFKPFVGSGVEMNSWALDLSLVPDQGPDGAPVTATPFGTEKLLAKVHSGLQDLRRGPTSVPGLALWEQIFVDGRMLIDGPAPFTTETFLRNSTPDFFHPVSEVSDQVVAAARGKVEGPVRHCLTVQVQSWSGDVILTVHVQAAVTEHTLHLYSTASVLPPVREEYRAVDRMTAAHGLEYRLRIVNSALSAGQGCLGRPVQLLTRHLLRDYWRDQRREELKEMIRYDKRFDFGARQSLRERAATPNYANYFQRIDVRRYSSQIELRVLSVLKDLLTEHGFDVSELEESRKTLLNNGIIMTGGVMSGAIAAGTGARATSEGARPGRAGGASAGPAQRSGQ